MFPLAHDSLAIAAAVTQALTTVGQVDERQFSSLDVLDVLTIIRWESGGDARAVNATDINAQEGHPSQGLMQVIPSTFKEFALPGYDQDITDPVSNVIAGVRYALHRYGSLQAVPGIVKLAGATQNVYVGY